MVAFYYKIGYNHMRYFIQMYNKIGNINNDNT